MRVRARGYEHRTGYSRRLSTDFRRIASLLHLQIPRYLSSSRLALLGTRWNYSVRNPLGVLGSLIAVVVVAACGGQEPPPRPPAAPTVPNDPPDLSRIAAACARVSACTHASDVSRFRDPGACVDEWLSGVDPSAKTPDPLRKCLLEATTCDRVHACVHGSGDARAATFCSRPGVVSGCDGDRLVSCGEDDAHESNVVDCAANGASCREVKSTGGLVVRACWSAQKCPAGAPETRCDGPGAVIACHDGAFERAVCAPGTTCGEHRDDSGDVSAACELPGSPVRCELRGARHCEQGRLVECDRSSPYRRARVSDCAGFGLSCGGLGPRARCTVKANVECDKELLPKCDGDSVVFCAAGRLTKVGCSGIGLGTCDPSAKGPIAACAPSSNAAPPPASVK